MGASVFEKNHKKWAMVGYQNFSADGEDVGDFIFQTAASRNL